MEGVDMDGVDGPHLPFSKPGANGWGADRVDGPDTVSRAVP